MDPAGESKTGCLERAAHGHERPPVEVCTASDLVLMLNSITY